MATVTIERQPAEDRIIGDDTYSVTPTKAFIDDVEVEFQQPSWDGSVMTLVPASTLDFPTESPDDHVLFEMERELKRRGHLAVS